MTSVRSLAVLTIVFLSGISISLAGDSEAERNSLKGLKGVAVAVDGLDPEVEQNGLSMSSIQTDIELTLREAGIPVLTRAEAATTPGEPIFHTIVLFQKRSGGLWAFRIDVGLEQAVRLARDPKAQGFAVTWRLGSFGTVGADKVRGVRDIVKDLVDEFVNAYLSVNPK